jgi:hypothetical protein
MTALDDDLLTSLQAARPDPGYQPSAASPVATAMLARILQTDRDPAPRGTRRRLLLAGLPRAIIAPGRASPRRRQPGAGTAAAVKESVRRTHMTIPAEQNVHRSRAIRARRQIPALIGGLTAGAAATAAAALVLTNGPGTVSGQLATAGHARTVVTAAWTVREDANGTVTITLRQYANPAGLQQTLRADGINAIVRRTQTVTGPGRKPGPRTPLRNLTNCSYATANDAPPAVQRAVVTIVQHERPGPRGEVTRTATFIIHPHAMPHGSALFLPYGTNTLATTIKGSRDPAKPAPPVYPHVKPFNPVVLNNDTVPACVPVTKPGSTAAPTAK